MQFKDKMTTHQYNNKTTSNNTTQKYMNERENNFETIFCHIAHHRRLFLFEAPSFEDLISDFKMEINTIIQKKIK